MVNKVPNGTASDDAELRLKRVDGAACVLVNRDQAWLMFLRSEGDAGFSSRNPDATRLPDAKVAFFLSNGQRNEYSVQCALPSTTVNHRSLQGCLAVGSGARQERTRQSGCSVPEGARCFASLQYTERSPRTTQ